jgi:hypothetical protein
MHNDGTHFSLIVTDNKRLMGLISAAHAWTWMFAVKHNAVKRPTKFITSINCKSYRPSGMLIHRQNSYAPRSRLCAGPRESQNREPVNKGKNLLVYSDIICLHCEKLILYFTILLHCKIYKFVDSSVLILDFSIYLTQNTLAMHHNKTTHTIHETMECRRRGV